MAHETRLDRFLWVIQKIAGEQEGAQAEFARIVGLNPKHVGVMLTRLRRSPDTAGLDGVTLGKMMKAIGVNPLWLLFGEEPWRIDTGDPDLAVFLATLSDQKELREVAFAEHAKVSEVKALLRLLETRSLKPYSSGEGGRIDWLQALTHYRDGKLRPSGALPSTKGTDQARAEQGPVPQKVTLPAPAATRRAGKPK